MSSSRPDGETAEVTDELLRMLGSLTDAVYTLDRDWHFTYLNSEAERLVQRSRGELLGRSVWDEFPEAADSELFDHYQRAVEEGRHLRIERYEYPPLDTVFDISVYPSTHGLAVLFRDVREHVDRERDLQRAAEEEQRAADRLRELDGAKNAFLSAVSHELRTPLTIVRGLAQQLHEMRGELDDAERSEMEDTILDQSRRLEQLLEDLLDVDRLERGALKARQRTCDLAAVVRAAVERHATCERVDLEVPDRLQARVDRSQIERIVANLLDNAAKYAPDGPILVRLSTLPDGVRRLEVIDHGSGIPAEDRERIFEPLYRVDHDHPRPGTGIGLSLVAAFAGLHDGRAYAVPRDGGAHICVDLPAGVSR